MDAVRVSFGIPEYGPELGEPFNPLEAGLIGSVDFTKGCYIGQEVVARLDSYKKVQKYLVSLRFVDSSPVFQPWASVSSLTLHFVSNDSLMCQGYWYPSTD